ncbi:MAG: hypothetical protein ACU85V_01830, partial [Gammaproteobacteria bacterium]
MSARRRAALIALLAACAAADAFDGGAGLTVSLVDAAGAPTAIGRVDFEAEDGGYAYRLSLDEAKFVDKFLSMRPFRCLEQPGA